MKLRIGCLLLSVLLFTGCGPHKESVLFGKKPVEVVKVQTIGKDDSKPVMKSISTARQAEPFVYVPIPPVPFKWVIDETNIDDIGLHAPNIMHVYSSHKGKALV